MITFSTADCVLLLVAAFVAIIAALFAARLSALSIAEMIALDLQEQARKFKDEGRAALDEIKAERDD